jgi:protein-disulfide isomerase
VVKSVRELLDDDQELKVVFKEFPILGEASVVAARASLAAREQGQEHYLPFHLARMGSRDLSLGAIMKLADQVGLDTERLTVDMRAPAIDQQLQANFVLAQKLGIEGTPAFVIGEDLVPGALDKARLASLVDEARANCATC